MRPSQLSAALRQIASRIDASRSPSKELVSRALRKIVVAMDKPITFADAVNANILHETVQKMLDDYNAMMAKMLARHDRALLPDERTPAWAQAWKVPAKVVEADLEDRDIGHVTVEGGNLTEPATVEFSADDNIVDWFNEVLLNVFPGS